MWRGAAGRFGRACSRRTGAALAGGVATMHYIHDTEVARPRCASWLPVSLGRDMSHGTAPQSSPVSPDTRSATSSNIDSYELHETLGTGKFGAVKRGILKATGESVAVKLIPKKLAADKKLRPLVEIETELMRKLFWHPHIVNLRDSFETDEHFVIVMDLANGGELFERILEKGHYTEADASDLMRAVMSAVEHCHARGVCHRDLKPENILLASKDSEVDVRLCDFGLAGDVTRGAPPLTGAAGTVGYLAPEQLRTPSAEYDERVDEFSLGVILYILLGGYHPFDPDCTADDATINRRTQLCAYTFEDESWEQVSESAKSLLKQLLQRDPRQRMTASQALQHPWLRGDDAPDRPLHSTAVRLKDFNDARRAWRNATTAALTKWFGHERLFLTAEEDRAALERAFQLIDANGDGHISKQELAGFLRRLEGRAKAEEIDAMYRAADLNGDDQISLDEFIAMNT